MTATRSKTEDVIGGDKIARRAGNDEFELTASLASKLAAGAPAGAHRGRIGARQLSH